MSCSLYWRPVKAGKTVGDSQLRDMLRMEFGDYPFRLGREALPFLRGLRAAGIEGSARLMDIIDAQEEVELYVEC